MTCPKCQSASVSVVPAEIRLYRNGPRTLSHPPMTPSPDVQVCLDCGWSEFSIPRNWLSAGWLQSLRVTGCSGRDGPESSIIAAISN